MPPVAFTSFPISADAASRQVRAPVWRVAIDGRDITRDITPVVVAVTFTDNLNSKASDGKSDDVEVVIADRDGRWRGAWYPAEGEKIEVWMGYAGESLLPCGRFEIDEVGMSGPPDTVTIKGLATGVIPAVRQRRSQAYEGQTLGQIVAVVARRHGLTVVGSIEPIVVERSTQLNETDLSYLARLGDQYGYVFSVRDTQLIFYKVGDIYGAPSAVTLRRTDVSSYVLAGKARGLFSSCALTYQEPQSGKSITRTVRDSTITNGHVLKIDGQRVEDATQADAQARAALKLANSGRARGSITLQGDPRIVAGSTVTLAGWGRLDAKYAVETSRHRMTRDEGYTVTLDVKYAA